MRILSLIIGALSAGNALAKALILDPPKGATGKPIAIVWIHGMQCKPEAYQKPALEFQKLAASKGYKAWIGLPEFLFDVPEPVLIDHYVTDMVSDLKKSHGFSGENIFMAAHSLGGVMTQIYTKDHSDLIKGQILMGSVLLRDKRSINGNGRT